jgi:cell division protease FtsH
LIENAHQEAYEILVANRDILDDLVEVLLEKETLLKDEIEMIFKKVRLVSRRPAWTGSETRKPSTQPPVALSPAKPQAPVVEEEAQAVRKPKKKATPPSE